VTEAEPEAYEGWTVREQSRIQLSRKSAGAHCHKMVFVRVGGVGMIILRTTLFGIAASALVFSPTPFVNVLACQLVSCALYASLFDQVRCLKIDWLSSKKQQMT